MCMLSSGVKAGLRRSEAENEVFLQNVLFAANLIESDYVLAHLLTVRSKV